MGCVYVATNTINGKQYVGKTSKTLVKRRQEHEYDSRNRCRMIFHRALKKYGIKSFVWQEVFEHCNGAVLNKVEIATIAELNTLSPNGYNRTRGGDSGPSTWTDEAKQKVRLARIGKSYAEIFGEERGKEIAAAISAKKKGFRYSAESRRKMSESHKGKKQSQFTIEKRRKSLAGKKDRPNFARNSANR